MGFYISKKVGFISSIYCFIFEVLAGISSFYRHINNSITFQFKAYVPSIALDSPYNTSIVTFKNSLMLKLRILPFPLEELKQVNRDDKVNFFPADPPWEEGTLLFPIPSSKGKIKTLLFVLPKDNKAKSKFNLFPNLREIINTMPTVETFLIIHRGDELDSDPEFKQWLHNQDRVKLKTIRRENGDPATDSELSIWAQDHFYPLQTTDNNHSHLNGLVGSLNDNFLFALQRVVNSPIEGNILPNFKLQKTKLLFEGGNILVGDKFMLVGANDFHDTDYEAWFGLKTIFVGTSVPPPTKRYHQSEDSFKNQFPVFAKNLAQPLFHLDLFLTLVGFNATKTTYTIVVGQPKLGVEGVEAIDDEFYSVLTNWLDQMKRSICSCIKHLKTSFEKDLNTELTIVPIPLVLIYNDIISLNTRKREWFWATYNNCLVENIPSTSTQAASKKVWLPSYGSDASNYHKKEAIPKETLATIQSNLGTKAPIQYGDWSYLEKYDTESRKTWEALGFEVFPLKESYIPFARQHGSLNCITNCLERGTNKGDC